MHASTPRKSILSGVPRPYRKYILLNRISVTIGFLAYVAITPLLDFFETEYVLGGFLIVLITAIVFGRRIMGRLSRQATAAGDRLCQKCCYNLTNRDSRGTCPECGFQYTFANCYWGWRYLRRDKHNPPTPPPELLSDGLDSAHLAADASQQ